MYRICLLGVIGIFSAAVLAADAPAQAGYLDVYARAKARFNQADRNSDGQLSLTEMQDGQDQRLAEKFARLDGNKDGGVSRAEMAQVQQQRKAQRQARHARRQAMRGKLKVLDSNQDQALTRAEIGDRMPRLKENFERLDVDHDGRITREELRLPRQWLRAPRTAQ